MFEGARPRVVAGVDTKEVAAGAKGASGEAILEAAGPEEERAQGEAVDVAPLPLSGVVAEAFLQLVVGLCHGGVEDDVTRLLKPVVLCTKERLDGGTEFGRDLEPPAVEVLAHGGAVGLIHELELEHGEMCCCDAFGADASIPFEETFEGFMDRGGELAFGSVGSQDAFDELASPEAVLIAL